MKVEMLNGGFFTSPGGLWRKGENLEHRIRFPIPVYLVDTGSERVLVDTGLNPNAVLDPSGHYSGAAALAIFEFEQAEPLAAQVDLETITAVVLTHLHFDHAGGLGQLPPSVPVFLQRREWEAGNDPAVAATNFLFPVDFECIADQVELLDGDRDLFGDGKIFALSTPGHTPGHQSVQVGEHLVLAGDVVHFDATLDDQRFPLFAHDHAAQAESAARLRMLRATGAVIRPGHDPDLLVPGPVELLLNTA
jgi:N-acyl homoserine lactone hydrolase